MKPLSSALFALFGVFFLLSSIIPIKYSIKLGYAFLALGLALLLAIPLSFRLKAHLPALYAALKPALLSLACFGAVLLIITGVQISSRYAPEDAPSGSPIVVLGAGLSRIDRTTPSLMLALRLDAAAKLMRDNPDAVCVVSGGQGKDELVSEAAAMKTYLAGQKGIEPERIILEDRSRDTEENLVLSAKLLRERGLVGDSGDFMLVTSGFHAFRSCFLASKAGLTPHSQPASVPLGLLPMYWLRESLAVIFEVWLG